MLHPQSIQLAAVLAAEVLGQSAAHQLLAKGDENPLLDLLTADGQAVRAGAARSCSKARQAITTRR
jgi:hypothetical protein